VLCTTVVHSDTHTHTHTHEQFLKMSVGLGLRLITSAKKGMFSSGLRLITSAKEGMLSSLFVCFKQLCANTSKQICMKFSEEVEVGNGPMNKRLYFGGDPGHRLDTGIVFRIRHYWEIQKVVNSQSLLIRQMAAVLATLVYNVPWQRYALTQCF